MKTNPTDWILCAVVTVCVVAICVQFIVDSIRRRDADQDKFTDYD